MTSTKTTHLPLSQEHAFVIQLHENFGHTPGELTGRVEHIPTGKNANFTSLQELNDFLGGGKTRKKSRQA